MVVSFLKDLVPGRVRRPLSSAVNRFRHLGRKGAWATVDQGVVSLGNFTTQFMLARQLPLEEYGEFGILFELMMFLNAVHGSLIVYPLTVRGAVAQDAALRQMSGVGALLTGVVSPILGLAIVVMAAWSGRIELAGWAMLALLAGQVQETLRRSLLASIGYREAVLGDAISYVGQGAIVVALAVLGKLSIVSAFQAMAGTSLLAIVLQYFQVRPTRSSLARAWEIVGDGWTMGRWMLFANFTTLLTGTGFIWNLAYWQSLHDVGVYGGLTNILRLANPLIITLSNVLIPTIVRARENSGLDGAKESYFKYAGFGFVIVLVLFSVPLLAPGMTLAMFYRSDSAFAPYASLLQIMLATQLLTYVHSLTGSFFNAIERGRVAFYGQVLYAGTIVLVGYPLAAVSLQAAVLGTTVAGVLHVAFLCYMMVRLRGERLSGEQSDGGNVRGDPPPNVVGASPSAAT